jgi:ribonuclease HII
MDNGFIDSIPFQLFYACMASDKKSSKVNLSSLFSHDERLRSEYRIIAGLDEAGRGPLAGPVVAAAVILPSGVIIEGLKDSKRIPEKERKRIFWKIVRSAEAIGVGMVDAETIDQINILRATKRAMELAVEDLGMKPRLLLIDAVSLQIDLEQQSIIKGESVSASIAAASVVAKTVRDDIMIDYHKEYPQYNFKRHKGYSTKEHMEKICVYGPSPVHRKSFRKVRDVPLPLE